MEHEVLKAVPHRLALKQFVLYALIGGLVLIFGKTLLFPWIKEYLSVSDKAELLFRFKIVMLGWSILILSAAAYVAFVAVRIIKSKRFPLPGAQVWCDTPIVRGGRALLRGWFLGFGALFLLGCALYAAYIPYIYPRP